MWVFILSCAAFALVLVISYKKKSLRLLNDDAAVKHPGLMIFLNVSGIFLFGILPALVYPFPNFFVQENSLLKMFVLITLVLTTSFVAFRVAEKDLEKRIFTVAPTLLSWNFLSLYFLVRILFISAYELWFRGFFLEYSTENYGIVYAVTINVVLYVLLHVVNGKREMLSCIPFGILLCLMAIWFGSPLPAVFIHLALTIPYDIQFVRIKSKTLVA
ncbi:MAG: CPBP family intramembrane metalloprotease [Weeksellaceae bacterium]|nr:CPBP family intramembrane metalloprotease [Weeksellaceae bacterium]